MKLIYKILFCIAGLLFCLMAVSITPKGYNLTNDIIIDSSRPEEILWPFEVSYVGDQGEMGLYIAPNVGRGWKDEAGGEAKYSFYISSKGQYYVWLYCLWFDACSNAVFAQFDLQDKIILGNDPIFGKWHWTKGPQVTLGQGTHDLILSNHSDNISIQKVFLTKSRTTKPDDSNLAFSDIFYDNFDGCDQGNYSLWEKVSGIWEVYDPHQKASGEKNSLIGCSKDRAILVKEGDWDLCSVNASFQSFSFPDLNAYHGICFGVSLSNSLSFYAFRWQVLSGGSGTGQLVYYSDGNIEVLDSFAISLDDRTRNIVEVVLQPEYVQILLDDNFEKTVKIDRKIKGGIGFFLEGETTCYFDDVHVREIIQQ